MAATKPVAATKPTTTRKRKPKAVDVINEAQLVEVPSEDLVPVVEAESIELLPTSTRRDWYVLRYLPENAGTPAQVKKAWANALKELDRLIKGQQLEYGISCRLVEGVTVRYILGKEDLVEFLAMNHSDYIKDGVPKYQFSVD